MYDAARVGVGHRVGDLLEDAEEPPEVGDRVGAVERLSWLDAPWERAVSERLRQVIEAARADPSEASVSDALATANSEYLL